MPADERTFPGVPARWIPTMDGLWVLIAIVLPVAVAFVTRTMAIDLAYQIRAGGIMLDTHRLLDVDTFTFTVLGRPWLNQQWGAEVLLAVLYRVGGWGGIAVARGLLLGCTTYLLYRACRAAGASPRTASLLTLAGWIVGIEILPALRPQQFGFVLFALTLWLVTDRGRSPRRLWLLPVVVAVWANLHGSFPLALVILGFAWLEDRRSDPAMARRLVAVTAVAVAATLVNPFGPRVWSYVADLSTHPVVSHRIAEWGPPSIHTPTGLFFFASLLAVGALVARRPRAVGLIPLLKLGIFAVLALLAIRGVVWWALVAPVVVSEIVSADTRPTRPLQRSPLNAVFAAVMVLATVIVAPVGRGSDPITHGPAVLTYAPESLIAPVRAAVPGGSHVFVSQLYASWSEFSAPDLLVEVDARIEIFPEPVWADYYRVSNGQEGWARILDAWGVNALVLHPQQAEGLLEVIGEHPEWRRIGSDASGSSFVRSDLVSPPRG